MVQYEFYENIDIGYERLIHINSRLKQMNEDYSSEYKLMSKLPISQDKVMVLPNMYS